MFNNHCFASGGSQATPKAKYAIHEKIGSGAYGEVYKGLRDDDRQPVALKRIMITDEDGYNNIPLSTHRELNVLRRLNSLGNDNIVRLFDIVLNKIGGRMCIDLVFELSEYDLEVYLKQYNMGGDMPIYKILDLGNQLLDGVHFMHSHRVIHRDLKPANILIDRLGRDLKITDFGLARVLGFDNSLTPVSVTLWYRAPEILFKSSYLTACDLWSVGCVIGEMIYGRALFATDCEVKQMEKIVCRLGMEAVEHWPEDFFIDSSSFTHFIDPARSIDSILKRADIGLRSLIKDLLRFDPNDRILSTEALVKLKELRRTYSQSTPLVNGGGRPQLSTLLSESALESQNLLVVNSVLNSVLGDDFDGDGDCSQIPGVTDGIAIEDYPHGQVEVTGWDSEDNSLEKRQEDAEEADGVGDSFGSYRSHNNNINESFSSYGPSSSPTGVTTDEDRLNDAESVKEDLHELREFHNGFIISDCSGSNTGSDINSNSNKDDTLVTAEEPLQEQEVGNVSPFLLSDCLGDDLLSQSSTNECDKVITRQNSIPFHEKNSDLDETLVKNSLKKQKLIRKRINSSDDSGSSSDNDRESVSEIENSGSALCRQRPTIGRHKSQRRRISVVGQHVSTDRRKPAIARRATVLVIPSSIRENEEIQNTSFGEASLSRALDSIKDEPASHNNGDNNMLSGRPKFIVRRRSQYK